MTAVVGIAGPSYCGSTVFERIIGRHQGVQTVGESHWLVDNAAPWRRRCSYCDEADCPVFTPELLAEAKNHGDEWFEWLQNAAGRPKILLSSDKNITIYDRIGRPDKAIVLFRSPIAWCTSWVVNAGRQEERYAFRELPRLPDAKVEKAAAQYVMQYNRIFDWLKQYQMPYIIVDMNALVDTPRTWVSWVCSVLNTPFLPESLNIGDDFPLHSIGGNPDVVFGRAPKVLRNNAKWRQILTVAQHQSLIANNALSKVLKRLTEQPSGGWRIP